MQSESKAMLSEMRDAHALRKQRGKRHVGLARIGEHPDMFTCGSCDCNKRDRKDV